MKHLVILVAALLLTLAIGCSGSIDSPTSPMESAPRGTASTGHQLWGLYKCIVDPASESIEVVPMRDAVMHLNALHFLEPPAMANLTLESVQFNGDIIEADIGLRHPFLGLDEFTGFDVCGILISRGSISPFSDTGLVFPGDNDLHLVNPDGFSRWWNPNEFPVNTGTMFSYQDGLLGAPDSFGNFTATLNGYKYFCDALDDPDDPMTDIDPSDRGVFSAGMQNIRHYTIDMGTAGLVFNYAIDANWEFPMGDPPYVAPDDFTPEANRPEAWNVVVNILQNTLYNEDGEPGGDLNLEIDVYDWYNVEMNTVTVASPGNFDTVIVSTPSGGGDGYATYAIDIIDPTPAPGSIDLYIEVSCEAVGYGGFISAANQAAYFIHPDVPVAGDTPGPCDEFTITGVDPPSALPDEYFADFTVYGTDFQDGLNLAIDLMDGLILVVQGTSVDFTDSETLTCVMDFDSVDGGMYDLRVTNGCEPVSRKTAPYAITGTSDGGENYNPRPYVPIYDFGIGETNGIVTVMFSDMNIFKYNSNYSSSAETGLHANMTRTIDSLVDEGVEGMWHPLGSYSGMNPVLCMLNWGGGVILTGIISDDYNYVIDVTETNAPEMQNRCYLWKHWEGLAIRSVYARKHTNDPFAANVTTVPNIGTGAGEVYRNAVKAIHISRDNDDPTYACWVYALEGSPAFEIERYDLNVSTDPHSLTWDLTICDGTKGDGPYQLNNPKDISGDTEDRIYVLDQDSTNHAVVKIYNRNGVYLGSLQNNSVITGLPLRLDVNENDDSVHIAHTNGIAVWTADEMPWN